ncbi:LysM domain-containing protein [Jiella sp. M17.18]|uniref:LysM peptidoglycan-binding domain-containing protein n=1 Tax=Jiella sp. M17.18 TaxID=3234247 RepID=UPI0034E016BD
MRTFALTLAAATLLPAAALAQAAPAQPCGKQVEVQPHDTISAIAGRCDVSEGLILRANPGVDSSADLRVGETLSLVGPVDQLGSMASEAGKNIAGAAKSVGSKIESSVGNFLDRNPQLNQHVRSLGQAVGLGSDNTADVSLTPNSAAPGETVTLSATGLPKDTPVVIGGGLPGSAYSALDQARTTPDGTLQLAIKLPADLPANGRYQISVRAQDGGWKAAAPVIAIR